MSTNAKTVTWIVVIVVVVGGIWWWWSMGQTTVSPITNNNNDNSAMTMTSTPNGTSSETSNADLQASLSNVDSQMNGFSSDNASINQGMNDQPVQQEQM